jgi:uncharacterized protein (DUF924 family)
MSNDQREIDELLGFWFGDSDDDAAVAQSQSKLWWSHDPATDNEIKQRFGDLVARAAAGELDDWAETARGRLALILLFDQLPRNIHRGFPKAFATDPRALRLALEGLQAGVDEELRPIEKVFLMMPLEHSESLDRQEESVRRFRALAEEAPENLKATFEYYLDYAVRHRDIIARFGRFPHRNELLGRISTSEELAFLEEPGSSF